MDIEQMKYLYIEKRLSTPQVAGQLGVSTATVQRYLRQLSMMRTLSEAAKLYPHHGSGPKRIELDIEQMRYLYNEKKLSAPQIAKKFGTNKRLILSRLREMGITRSRSEAAKIRNRIFGYPIGYRKRHSSGYMLVKEPSHPRASQGWVFEHILVWENHHKKHLPPGWHIHHLNGLKDDNRPSNLVALPLVKHRKKYTNLLEERATRIRELEIEISQLRSALQSQQMIFTISEN